MEITKEQWKEQLTQPLLAIPGVSDVKLGKHGLIVVVTKHKRSEMYNVRCQNLIYDLFTQKAPDLPFRIEMVG